MPWRLLKISDDGRDLTVLYLEGDGNCTKPVGFEVQQSGIAVEILALSKKSGSCAAEGVQGQAVITLAAPLGQRPLLHAPAQGSI